MFDIYMIQVILVTYTSTYTSSYGFVTSLYTALVFLHLRNQPT